MQIIRDIEQGSADWHALRTGIITCSELDSLLSTVRAKPGLAQAHLLTWTP